VREVAREVTAESLTDLPPSVGLPEGKVARHLGTMGLNTLGRKPPYLPTSLPPDRTCGKTRLQRIL
jgi:hypothetical protein